MCYVFWKMMGHIVVEHSLGSLAAAKDMWFLRHDKEDLALHD